MCTLLSTHKSTVLLISRSQPLPIRPGRFLYDATFHKSFLLHVYLESVSSVGSVGSICKDACF